MTKLLNILLKSVDYYYTCENPIHSNYTLVRVIIYIYELYNNYASKYTIEISSFFYFELCKKKKIIRPNI